MAASAAGSTAGLPDQKTASGYGHFTRSCPQDSASNAAAPQWEPRKPLAGIHAAMRADEMLERVMWRAMRSGSGW